MDSTDTSRMRRILERFTSIHVTDDLTRVRVATSSIESHAVASLCGKDAKPKEPRKAAYFACLLVRRSMVKAGIKKLPRKMTVRVISLEEKNASLTSFQCWQEDNRWRFKNIA